jgi:hypothetical protein
MKINHGRVAGEPSGTAGPDDCTAAIDAGRIAALMARDWGFHHTATANLARVQGAAAVEPRFGADAAARIDERAGLLLAAIDAEPKTRGWRLRDRIGSASGGGRTWTRRRPRTGCRGLAAEKKDHRAASASGPCSSPSDLHGSLVCFRKFVNAAKFWAGHAGSAATSRPRSWSDRQR